MSEFKINYKKYKSELILLIFFMRPVGSIKKKKQCSVFSAIDKMCVLETRVWSTHVAFSFWRFRFHLRKKTLSICAVTNSFIYYVTMRRLLNLTFYFPSWESVLLSPDLYFLKKEVNKLSSLGFWKKERNLCICVVCMYLEASQMAQWWRIHLQARDAGSDLNPWAEMTPWRREWQSTPVFLPGESHGQRSLMGYSR